MMTDYGVRVIVAYENKRVGQVIFPPGILRQRLVQIGLVETVQAPESERKFGKRLTLKA